MTTLCQAASHPFALEPTIRSRLKRDDIRNMREELAALEDKTPIAENLIDKASMPATGILPFIKALRVIKALPVGYFGGVVDMDFILRLAENESTIRDKSCSVCDKPMKGRANATVNKSKASASSVFAMTDISNL